MPRTGGRRAFNPRLQGRLRPLPCLLRRARNRAPYSLATVRNAVRDHYKIANIRTGLRAYRLVDLTTDLDQDQLRRDLRAESRREFTEYEDRARLQCPWCDVRYYDGNRFTHCYWCHRILTDGLDGALDDYLDQDLERTGASMRLAYRRMVAAGLIDEPEPRIAVPPTVSPSRSEPENYVTRRQRPNRMETKTQIKWGLAIGTVLGLAIFIPILIALW